jgi:hypothetical protein
MVLGIQIAGSLFALFMIYYSFINFKKNDFTAKEFSFWFFVWLVFILISLFPNVLDPIVVSLNIARTLDLFIIAGVLVLLGVMFYTYDLTRKTQNKLETLVRKLAIEKKRRR